MKRFSVFCLVAGSLVATPLAAGPPAKRPYCQVPKPPARDVRREPCRKPPIPPFLDRTPMFWISTSGNAATAPDIA